MLFNRNYCRITCKEIFPEIINTQKMKTVIMPKDVRYLIGRLQKKTELIPYVPDHYKLLH